MNPLLDPNYQAEERYGTDEFPLTLEPRLVRNGFAVTVDGNEASEIRPSAVVRQTEYSTFTYFVTSLEGDRTVTSTDIVVSSNVVTKTEPDAYGEVLPTPVLPNQQPTFVSLILVTLVVLG